jgi:threonine/homoserine/homoserine lactone efflux protein
MISFLTAGFILGFSAGLSPGPLLALVITETLRHNLKAGLKVAVAPLITDFPIILLTVVVLEQLSRFKQVLGGISILGSFFVAYLGYQSIRTSGIAVNFQKAEEKSLRKGIIVNFLSPHPYLFWFSVGAPITVRALNLNVLAAAAFIGSFYLCLVGSKIAVAAIVSRSRSFLAGNMYIYTLRFLGFLLLIFAGLLFYNGVKLLIQIDI